jgi:phospholipase/lecithinase/hemolysin
MNTISIITSCMIRACVMLVAASLLPGAIALAQPSEFARIVSFGDSLGDPGNAFVLTGEISTPPFEPIPGAAYAIGGHHFSNGRTWVEQLGQTLGLRRSTGPAVRNPVVFSNYAIGGSRAREGAAGVSANQQLSLFLSSTGGSAPGDGLYIFGFGGNDVRDALVAGPAGGAAIVQAAIDAIADNLLILCTSGAQHILVLNVANLGIAPFVQALGEPTITAATLLSAGINDGIEQAIANFLQPQCPETQFYVLDLFAISTAVFADPGSFGFVDAQPCLEFGQIGNVICSNRDQKFFWDGIHPTRAGHALITSEALKLLTTL